MKHRFWHWFFAVEASIPYRFVRRWWGTKVEYKNVYCSLCKRIVRTKYQEEPKR